MAAVRLLIVDDVAQVRQDLRTALTLAGDLEIVGEAADGAEAVHLAKLLRPQAILMDLEMPVMDGYDATRQIKAICPPCRIVALSVHSYREARQRAAQAGADDFVEKGASLERLVRAILGPSQPAGDPGCRSMDRT